MSGLFNTTRVLYGFIAEDILGLDSVVNANLVRQAFPGMWEATKFRCEESEGVNLAGNKDDKATKDSNEGGDSGNTSLQSDGSLQAEVAK